MFFMFSQALVGICTPEGINFPVLTAFYAKKLQNEIYLCFSALKEYD